jgi:YD repeat-containing protein
VTSFTNGRDAQGRRVSESNSLRRISSRTAVYDDDDRLEISGNYAYDLDEDGFLTAKTYMGTPPETTTYAYARNGQLNSVTLPDNTVIEYVHNAASQRVAKKVNGAITEKYLWAGMTGLLAVYDGANNLLIRFEGAKMVKSAPSEPWSTFRATSSKELPTIPSATFSE